MKIASLKKFGLILIVLIIGIQFVRPNRPINVPATRYDLLKQNVAPSEVARLLKVACYDCHSTETRSFWYSSVAPISWLIDYDVRNGVAALNFSKWDQYTYNDQVDIVGKILFEMYDDRMPLKPYVMMHKEARLTKQQKNMISEWMQSLVE